MALMTNCSPELTLLATRLEKVFAETLPSEVGITDVRAAIFRVAKLCGLFVKEEGKVFLENGRYVIQDWLFDFVEDRS